MRPVNFDCMTTHGRYDVPNILDNITSYRALQMDDSLVTRDAALARVDDPPAADLHESSAILACAPFNMAAAVGYVPAFPDTTCPYSVSGAASARELKTAALG